MSPSHHHSPSWNQSPRHHRSCDRSESLTYKPPLCRQSQSCSPHRKVPSPSHHRYPKASFSPSGIVTVLQDISADELVQKFSLIISALPTDADGKVHDNVQVS
jgi:hypothetical protein